MKLTRIPNKILRVDCESVTDFEELTDELIDQMYVLMHDNNGAGLAAPQAGIAKRFFITDFGDGLFVNPVYHSLQENKYSIKEGCLSLPGLNKKVARYSSVMLRYFTRENKMKLIEFGGLQAQIVQHETDHLSGILLGKKK